MSRMCRRLSVRGRRWALWALLFILSGCGSGPGAGTPIADEPTPPATPSAIPPTATADLPSSSTPDLDLPDPTPEPTPVALPPEHLIGIRDAGNGGAFYQRDSGAAFVPRGVNYVFVPHNGGYTNLTLAVGIYDAARTRADFLTLTAHGYNTVRVFLDACNAGPACIGDADNEGLNPAYLDNIVDMLGAARESGLFVLFTSNDLPDQGGYAEEANAQAGPLFAGYRNSYYLTPGAVNATRRYWRDLLTGLTARRAATEMVLGWQLLNEQWMFVDQPPLSLTSGLVTTTTGTYDMANPDQKARMISEGLVYYIAQMKEEILLHDPTALVTMGFFAPQISTPDWYVETASLLQNADLDFFDFHGYPGTHTLLEHAEAYGMVGYTAKPILLGEYGAFRHIYPTLNAAARVITAWQADACALGFDGLLYWTYYPANSDVGDRTWSFVDEGSYLRELLAPATHPDPCVPIDVPRSNLAYGRPVRASASLPDQPPEAALDENAETQWGAGVHPPQWIQVDLEAPYDVTEIRILVAQYPAGRTVHELSGWRSDGTVFEIHRFDQVTVDGDWLVFTPETAIARLQGLTITTVDGPSWVSWREIEILGTPSR